VKTEELLEILIKKCRIYDLELPRYEGSPCHPPAGPPHFYFLYRQHGYYYKPETNAGPRSSSSGLLMMSDHSGTHIDARCHQGSDMMLPGGIKVGDVESPRGYKKLGAEEIPPIIKRGVLVDVATYKGPLSEKYEIKLNEFQDTLKAEMIEVRKDDVVLVRTGYDKYWDNPEKYEEAAGVSEEVSLWLGEKEVFAIGIDNLAWDVPDYSGKSKFPSLPAHLHLLARKGIYIMENLNLQELSRDKVYDFVFVGASLKIKGATGSPIRPLAVAGV